MTSQGSSETERYLPFYLEQEPNIPELLKARNTEVQTRQYPRGI